MTYRTLSKNWNRSLIVVLGCFALTLLFSGNVMGQASPQLGERKTLVTFDQPVEVPGSGPQVLPAGSYIFKVVDSKVNRNIVQISNKEENHVYTTILAIPTRREVESDKTIMTFEERQNGQPQALRAWFYPYERTGQEFVYPKGKATQLSKASNSPVPYTDSVAESGPAPLAVAVPVVALTESPIRTMLPTGETTQLAQLEQPPIPSSSRNTPAAQSGPTTTPAATQSDIELPKTASTLPLLLSIGLMFLAVSCSLKVFFIR